VTDPCFTTDELRALIHGVLDGATTDQKRRYADVLAQDGHVEGAAALRAWADREDAS
jgi:hypothetical protein